MSWDIRKNQDATVFSFQLHGHALTVVIATERQAKTPYLYTEWTKMTGKKILHVACATAPMRMDFVGKRVPHSCHVYGDDDVFEKEFHSFWEACLESAKNDTAVLIFCQQGFHRSPLLLAALMIKAGMTKDEAFRIIGDKRSIYHGCTAPFAEWPREEKNHKHQKVFWRRIQWLNKLMEDMTAYRTQIEQDQERVPNV